MVVVSATGTATGTGSSGADRARDLDNSNRVHKAMDDAYLKAVVDGVNDPDEIRERKLKARTDTKARIKAEQEADALNEKVRRLKTRLEEMRTLLAATGSATVLVQLNEIEAALQKVVDEAFRRL